MARNPHAALGEPGAFAAEHGGGRAVRHDAGLGIQHDHPGDHRQPDIHAMLDHDQRRGVRVEERPDRRDHLADTLRVEIGRGLVQEQDAWAHRQRAGQGEPLLLAAGERLGGAIQRHVEPDGVQRRPHARPDLRPRDAEVLAPEGDVVADPGEHDLRIRVLQHQPRPAARRRGRLAVDEERALGLALVVAAEHTRESVEERRLARSRRAEQQHPLPGFDAEGQVAQRPGAPAGVPPAPAARLDRGGGGGERIAGHARRARARPGRRRSGRAHRSWRVRAPAPTAGRRR